MTILIDAQANLAQPDRESLPIAALLALAMTGFICIATETLPAGLLPQMADGLQISQAMAGQTVTAYAVGSMLAAIPLTLLTQTWSRRTVLLLTVLGFLTFNTLTALTTSVWLTMVARLLAGAAAGLAWSLLAGYARRMVAPAQQGRAMAIAMVGTPIALSVGVPLGTWLGAELGWRMSFGVMSGLSLLLIAWILIAVPDYPGQSSANRIKVRHVIAMPGVPAILAVVLFWMLAHNLLYTYVAPLVTRAGLGDQVELVLLSFGLAALVGIAITGRLVDRALRAMVQISLAAFALTALVLAKLGTDPVIVLGAAAVWGLTFGGAATLVQTALADTAGQGADVALSLNVVVWNAAIALGSMLGGWLLRASGPASFPWAALVLTLVALLIVTLNRRSGFRTGPRD